MRGIVSSTLVGFIASASTLGYAAIIKNSASLPGPGASRPNPISFAELPPPEMPLAKWSFAKTAPAATPTHVFSTGFAWKAVATAAVVEPSDS
jgi:hypothetical protein